MNEIFRHSSLAIEQSSSLAKPTYFIARRTQQALALVENKKPDLN